MREPLPTTQLAAPLLRWLLVITLVITGWPAHADTRVRVTTDESEPYLFLVSVSTHHADLHNGNSRVRFQELLSSNETHHIDTGFYFTLVHYGAWAYHPDFLMSSVSSEGRSDAMPDIAPRTWRELLAAIDKLPITGTGPTYARAAEHVRMYPKYYLPALDRANVAPAQSALQSLTAFLASAEQLSGPFEELSEQDQKTLMRLRQQADQSLSLLDLQLSLDRRQRTAVREFEQLTAGPKPMIAALLQEPGMEKITRYLSALEHSRDAKKIPVEPTWLGEHVDVQFTYRRGAHYRLRTDDYPDPLSCNRGSVEFDGRHLAGGLDPNLVKSVDASFCRHPDGTWQLHSRWKK